MYIHIVSYTNLPTSITHEIFILKLTPTPPPPLPPITPLQILFVFLNNYFTRNNFSLSPSIIGVYPGVTTIELDELAAQTAASCATRHPDFSTLAARISVSNLHKQTSKVYSDVVEVLHSHVHPKTGQASPLVSEEVYNIVMEVRGMYIVWFLILFRYLYIIFYDFFFLFCFVFVTVSLMIISILFLKLLSFYFVSTEQRSFKLCYHL